MTTPHATEVRKGRRFEFGQNWRNFLRSITPERISASERDLKDMLQTDDLRGVSFLDVGSGSGLSSLAARRLGATVLSFDYDPRSVGTTIALRRRYFANDPQWQVTEGSVLDRDYVASLGQFDIVYSWGVLHHTGAMWPALDNVTLPVRPGGRLFIAIYNDMGEQSVAWRRIKECYNRLPRLLRYPYAIWITLPDEIPFAWSPGLMLRPRQYYARWREYLKSWKEYRQQRGMSRWHDIVDWVGGLPYEVATAGAITQFYQERGFTLEKLVEHPSLGNNQFVFRKG